MPLIGGGKHGKGSFRSNSKRGLLQESSKSMGSGNGNGINGNGISGSGISGVHLNISGRSTNEEDVLIPRSPRPPELNNYNPQNQTLLSSDNPLLNDPSSIPDAYLGTNNVQSFHQRLNQNYSQRNHQHNSKNHHSLHHLAHKKTTKRKGSHTPSFNSYLATSRNKNKIVVGSVVESAASELEVGIQPTNHLFHTLDYFRYSSHLTHLPCNTLPHHLHCFFFSSRWLEEMRMETKLINGLMVNY